MLACSIKRKLGTEATPQPPGHILNPKCIIQLRYETA